MIYNFRILRIGMINNEEKVLQQMKEYYGLNDEELERFAFAQLYKKYLNDFSKQYS
jgi:uncharacterized membrane protein (UPF0182 family)